MLLALIHATLAVAVAQTTYLDKPHLLQRVDSCLQNTYNFNFARARQFQRELSASTPDHPAPHFLEALIIYWENFPLMTEGEQAERFIDRMERSVELAGGFLENDRTYLEGVFFDLFGRAFQAMFWADNGKPARVIPDLGTMYRHTVEGFELKERFSEFYFSTGLYNYYIEAYPKAHPVYKPLVSFMRKGDRELGLKQLDHAIKNTIYLKVESMLFMSLIHLNYEKDLNTAAIYAEKLYREYPRNIYYQGHLVNILLYQRRFGHAEEVLGSMKSQEDPYSDMIRTLGEAFLDEQRTGNLGGAEKGYRRTLSLAGSFGPIANTHMAIAYMGLSRIYRKKGLQGEAGRFARKASNHTVYSFILEE